MVFVKILLRLQPLIILGLFAVFLQTFGWPAYKTFLKKEVFIKESHLSPSKLPAPGLTICVSPGAAVKSTPEDMKHFTGHWVNWFSYLCNKTFSSVDDFYDCVQDQTFSKDDLIIKESQDMYFVNPKMNDVPVKWKNFTDSMVFGNCLQPTVLETLDEGRNIKFFLNSNISTPLYEIRIHDPNFYLTTMNPSNTPAIPVSIDFNVNKQYGAFQYIAAEEHRLLDREGHSCTNYDQLDFNFNDCVADYVFSITNCKLRWDNYNTKTKYKECTDLNDIQRILHERNAFMGYSLEYLISTTGCNKPCRYRKYYKTKEMTFLTDPSGKLGFMFGFSSNSLTLKEEAYLYPPTSFIAEFGGSLGLFLGLSFLGLWDFFLTILKIFAVKWDCFKQINKKRRSVERRSGLSIARYGPRKILTGLL